jgi:hypothetical protein
MCKKNFTPAPWELSDMSCYDAMDNFTVCFHIGVLSTGEMIADCQSDNKADYERVKANAYLIRSAPKLYDLLQLACYELEMVANWCEENNMPDDAQSYTNLICGLHAALAEARGEKND